MFFSPLIIQPPTTSPSPGLAMLPIAPAASLPTAVEASLTQAKAGNLTTITATTTLSGVVYFFWYLDGIYVGQSSSSSGSSSRSFALTPAEQARVEVLCSNSPDFDPIANAPQAWPSRRMLVFTRSRDAGIVRYEIQQQANGGAWTTIGTMLDDARTWLYQFLTPSLSDLTNYAWRVIPLDGAGQAGTTITLAAELIVRTPDAPDFSFTFNSGSGQITLAAA